MWSRRSRENEDLVRQRLRAVWPSGPDGSGGVPRWPMGGQDDDDFEDLAGAEVFGPDPGQVGPGPGDAGPGDAGAGPAGGRAALGAFDPGRRGLRALLVVAAVVVVVAGYLFWRGQPHVEPAPGAPSATVPVSPADPSAPNGTIVVAVTGRVVHPGLVRLPDGARVEDALAAAGGVLPGTDISFLNLARRLTDGELLVVGVTPPPQAVDGGAAGAPGGDGRVNINTGTVAELDTLPGIGPALAQRIVDYRAAHGPFHSIDELRKVSGIGDAKFAELKDRVTV